MSETPTDQERRFGRRFRVDGGGVYVRLLGTLPDEDRREPVRIFDHSIAGVGFYVDRRVELPIGQSLLLEIAEAAIPVRIRRSTTAPGSRLTYHGAEFVNPNHQTAEHIAAHLPLAATEEAARLALAGAPDGISGRAGRTG